MCKEVKVLKFMEEEETYYLKVREQGSRKRQAASKV